MSITDDNMKLYTADVIRKMMPCDSYTAEDFVLKIIMPKIVYMASQNEYCYDFILNDSPWVTPERLKDISKILIELGFSVHHIENYGGSYTIEALRISWDKKKSDKLEIIKLKVI